MMVKHRSQDRVAVAERIGVPECLPQEAPAVSDERPALHQSALPGQALYRIGTEQFWVGQVLTEIDTAGPVFGARKGGGFEDSHRHAGTGQTDTGAQSGTTRAHDNDVSCDHPYP